MLNALKEMPSEDVAMLHACNIGGFGDGAQENAPKKEA